MTPPAGPDCRVRTGVALASATGTIPPPELITVTPHSMPPEARRRSRFSKYAPITGLTYASITTVLERSYSLISGRISLEVETGTSGQTRVMTSRA